MFGQQQQQPQSGTGFGFGKPQQQTASLFGQAAGTSGAFGSLQQTLTPASGQQQPSSGQTQNFGFGQQQQPQQSSSLFGTPQNLQQQGTSIFGQQPQQQLSSSGGLFGQSAQNPSGSLFGSAQQTQQQQPSGNLFGSTQQNPQQQPSGGLFGSTKPSSGLFGTTATPSTTNQPSVGLFGSSTQAGQSLFGSSSAQPSQSLFGTQLQQPTQQPTQSLFGTQQQPSQSLFGTQQQQSAQQQNTLQTTSTTLQELEEIMSSYDPNDSRCKFRHAFYNLVDPSTVSRYTKPQNVPDGLWNEAVSNSPDPTRMVPVFATGFEDLQKRIQLQNSHATDCQNKIREISDDLDKVSQTQQIEVFSRLVKCQKRYSDLVHKVLRIMKLIQILRAKGHPSLSREEEALRTRLDALTKAMHHPLFKGRVDELEAQMKIMKASQKATHPVPRMIYEFMDDETLKNIEKVLEDMQIGLKNVTNIIKDDLASVDSMEKEYKLPPPKPNENQFRNTIY